MDPREAKMEEMERMLVDYQEKLESVTTNYEDKVQILEKTCAACVGEIATTQ